LRVAGRTRAMTEPKYGVFSRGIECPVMQMCMPPSWPPLRCVIERTMQ
jgi:hypothetical protein